MSHVAYRIPPWVLDAAVAPWGWQDVLARRAPPAPVPVQTITVDWDDVHPRTRVLRHSLRIARSLAYTLVLQVRTSASGRGVHLRGRDLRGSVITPYRAFQLRDILRDDRIRLTFDAYRWSVSGDPTYATGILFDRKVSEDGITIRAGPWHPLVRL